MGIPIPGKDGLYIETGPRWGQQTCAAFWSHVPLFSCYFSVMFKLIWQTNTWSNSGEIALRWIPRNPTDEKSTLVQVMAWWNKPLPEPLFTQVYVERLQVLGHQQAEYWLERSTYIHSSFNGYQRFRITFGSWMTSFKMTNEISRNRTALQVSTSVVIPMQPSEAVSGLPTGTQYSLLPTIISWSAYKDSTIHQQLAMLM